MKKLIYYLKITGLSLIIWIILSESISLYNLTLGVFFTFLSIFIVEKILGLNYFNIIHNLKLKIVVKYAIYLIYQIYFSGFSAISKIISGKTNVGIVEISTNLKDDMFISLLANSITLTPGTVTLDKSGNKLKVLCLDIVTYESEKAGKLIKKDFEKILSGG
ncbi:UNVERIFIED_CONTAM: multicomponent Na+:H+ antiporter subunit E [Acetivibrio alkalicellulosi]